MITAYEQMVSALKKSGNDIVKTITGTQADLLHMAVGVVGEAGELIDAVKKHVIYGKELDRDNMIEELGDIEFFMEGIRQILGISRKETLDWNMAKLSVRYEKMKYSDQAAQARADKAS